MIEQKDLRGAFVGWGGRGNFELFIVFGLCLIDFVLVVLA